MSDRTISAGVPAEGFPRIARLSLAQRFALAGGVVMLGGAVAMGGWVANRIEAGVVDNSAITTALYMESFIAPLSQELQRDDVLSDVARRAMTEIFTNTPLGERVISYKIWKRGGLIADASNPELIGESFEVSEHLKAAWGGDVVASFEDLHGEESVAETRLNIPLLEIYSPVREVWSGEIIAVAEFYENGTMLKADIAAARRTTWLVVAAIMSAMAALLFGIVLGGSRTITRQQATLQARVSQLSDMAEQNRALGMRVQRASGRAAALNERYLRRISADLHDGPAQLLALASLRLDRLTEEADEATRTKETEAMRASLDLAMRDIRDICRGLTLPEIEEMELEAVIRRAVDAHEAHSGTSVEVSFSGEPPADLAHSEKICAYRFVQEGLSNAFRHAGGAGQKVTLASNVDGFRLSVSDAGPGMTAERKAEPGCGLGLAGLQERVESLGGVFATEHPPTGGLRIVMSLTSNEGR